MKKPMIVTLLASSALTFAGLALAEPPHGDRDRGAAMLEKLDQNGDGNISRDEISASHAERFASSDADGDGIVTRAEFDSHRQAMREERRARRADRQFGRLDSNGDGQISAAEYEAVHAARMEARFTKIDADGDGVISESERDAMKSHHRKHGRRGGQ